MANKNVLHDPSRTWYMVHLGGQWSVVPLSADPTDTFETDYLTIDLCNAQMQINFNGHER